jgi:UDPglucose--hexose-1-phosphate uridylyltransferase
MADDTLQFVAETITARLVDPTGKVAERPIEVRTHPISGRRCRITLSRAMEREPGTAALPPPPPDAGNTAACPFCMPQRADRTPGLDPSLSPTATLQRGNSVLFPNLFPYGAYSAVCLFDDRHFVEIGKASVLSYAQCFANCAAYLAMVKAKDPHAVYMAIAQNFLPAAGGSLVHPHLQVHADRVPSNHHRFYVTRAREHFQCRGSLLFGDYLACEQDHGVRTIGQTGPWQWLAAFAPEGFFEVWAVLPGVTSLLEVSEGQWNDLARGVLNTQHFYRSLHRNSYNLGLFSIENADSVLELRCVMVARSNYAPWVRSDHTSYEVMLGDMATFHPPEKTAELARPFWNSVSNSQAGRNCSAP